LHGGAGHRNAVAVSGARCQRVASVGYVGPGVTEAIRPVGVLSELIWGTLSPWGFGGYIIPFLVAGEVLYALAGWAASRVWQGESWRLSSANLYLGALLAVCAFVWDLETQAGSALVAFWPTLTWEQLAVTEFVGIPFMFAHEVSDLFTGAVLAPLIIFYASRYGRPRTLSGNP